ncbi:MAG: hypothetical protein HFJ28_07480 [Clostridia bacterium]|nr:hypothetical protein [Clostridia bacterium]
MLQKISKKYFNSKFYLKILFLFLFILFIFSVPVQANIFNGNPEIVDKLNSAFEKIEGWMLKLSTPAAAVAVAVGVFMKKFSFGDEERIRIAKKLIRGSLFSYAFILVLDLILSAIQTLLK